MKDLNVMYPIDGTAARKPDCSRYSNENEHIIDFTRAVAAYEKKYAVNPIEDAYRARMRERVHARCARLASESQLLTDFRYGNVRGMQVTEPCMGRVLAAASVYAVVAIGAICLTL